MQIDNVEVEEEHVDDRSVDDLLSFINGENGGSKGTKSSKNKKKNRRRKDEQKSTSNEAMVAHNKPSGSEMSRLQGAENDIFTPTVEFGDVDMDDEIDPVLKEKIDREVEDFARRLNSDWPERMQELLSLGQGRRPVHFAINGNGTLRGYGRICAEKFTSRT